MQITRSRVCCATCAHWSGPRQLDSYCTSVIVDREGVKGKCFVGGRSDPQANGSCAKYEKWSGLK